MVPAQRLELNNTVERLLLKGFTQVKLWTDEVPYPWFTWKLVPVKNKDPSRPSSEALGLGSLPSYDGDAGQSSTRVQHAPSEHDEFGTVVTEITTTVVQTRKKYRVEDS